MLAGQYYDYLVRALGDYKNGRRNNPIMKGFAGPLSKQDITELRRELAQGQTPRVWFTNHVVRLPPGGSARVVHIDTPAEGDFIHAKPAGRPDDALTQAVTPRLKALHPDWQISGRAAAAEVRYMDQELAGTKRRPVPVVVLPGFPTSAIFTFHEFIAPVLRRLAGRRGEPTGTVSARLPLRVNSERGRTE